jgi:diacylglycerol kinase (ATP)
MLRNEKLLDSNAPLFSWKARLKSFVYAWEGILNFFRCEPNAQIHLVITFLVLVLSVILGLTKWEAIAVVFSVAFVWITEMLNTAIEKIMDFITIQKHVEIKFIKDVSAGAVLIASVAAVIVGCFIFIPKLIAL